MTDQVGTPYYMAPEVLQGRYTQACDIWSCGVLTYLMLSGSPPFAGKDDRETLQAVAAGKFAYPLPEWGQVSQVAKDMISLMLTVDPVARPDADSLMGHEWLKRGDVKGKQPLPSVVRKMQKFNDARRLKRVCLTLIATQLPKKDIEELRLYFKSLDKNGDGTISRKELTEGLQSQAKALPGMNPKELDKLMAIDSDGSGSIDYTEFLAAAIDRQTYQQRDVIWSAFRTFDIDGNGKINKQELKNIMESNANQVLDEAKLKALITEADKDGDGLIDFEEFMAMMTED